MNQIIVEGKVVEDVKESTTLKGCNVATIKIEVANSEGFMNGDLSTFEIITYGSLADFCIKEELKDKMIRTIGRLKQNRWVDDTGKPHSAIVIIAEHIEISRSEHGK